MKSIKILLFSIGGLLAVVAGVVISKPVPPVKIDNPTVVTKAEAAISSSFYGEVDLTTADTSLADISESQIEEPVTEPDTKPDVKNEDKVTTAAAVTVTSTTAKQTTNIVTTVAQEQITSNSAPTSDKITAVEDVNMTVYITKTGSHYHYANPCGRGNYYPTTLGEAIEKGLTPCSKCVH